MASYDNRIAVTQRKWNQYELGCSSVGGWIIQFYFQMIVDDDECLSYKFDIFLTYSFTFLSLEKNPKIFLLSNMMLPNNIS